MVYIVYKFWQKIYKTFAIIIIIKKKEEKFVKNYIYNLINTQFEIMENKKLIFVIHAVTWKFDRFIIFVISVQTMVFERYTLV